MTDVKWQSECAHCHETFSLEESEAHAANCAARARDRFTQGIVRPRAWSYGAGLVREVLLTAAEGSPARRVYFAATTEQVVSRAQLVAFRDLITLALEESPEAIPAVPPPPTSVPDATGAA